jgi:hypothetical protein
VTWAYFSVSASRRLVRPCAARTSAKFPLNVWGVKRDREGERPVVHRHRRVVDVRVGRGVRRPSNSRRRRAPATAAGAVGPEVEEDDRIAVVRIGPIGAPSASTTTIGRTNSSVTPAA